MKKMNQVSVSEFMSKSKEEMYDDAVSMVEKYNRLVDICNDSAERMADLAIERDNLSKGVQKLIGERDDLVERHNVYTSALNNDIAEKAAKIERLEKEIEGRKEGYTALKELMDTKYISIDEHNDVCKAYAKKVVELKKESEKWQDLAKMNRDTICNQYDVCEDFKKKISELEEKVKKEIEKLKVDLDFEREKYEKLAKANAELENDMRKKCFSKSVDYRELEEKYRTVEQYNKDLKERNEKLNEELDKTYTTKELDLKNHNKREMALVDELADKNDEIKSLKEENSYLKSEIKQKQNIIKKAYERYSDDIIKMRKDVLEVAYRDIEKDNGYIGFKLYVENTLREAKGNKEEANEVITDAIKFFYREWDKRQKENEETIKKAIKEVKSKRGTSDIPCGEDAIE